ncbi:formamidopyrimidine-DNA glycosylase [Beutenbergia cavernae DSM 12333]|uniref:Formamidopyrimidine-DNA glycosylase n=1 Tax=Beutenbergia cavernae (strain ATCC BAA-8 / DSM 12333 / CCUG 43141 / JCM 11478 / NBRC 16432 / NCIMB 13614 / HKI 0122) TaxID=471853 RepID=C5C3G7_BEUC1|nr:bifunctional DNA-formamidopyrimidine glycosylase/DNA-(apurinic or apyrimidinic site) lyase [Beutenbergia cavernae]ACQ79866.1 formamidopyrimidine-DNA glycosylase [Beutenbergia cavernae DSM 12333]
MPELPEVETVRAGLAAHALGRRIVRVDVAGERTTRRQAGGALALVDALEGASFTAAVRRGKFCWLTLDTGRALLVHLGMSGQLLVRGAGQDAQDDPRHLRARIRFADDGELLFIDQRTFGYLTSSDLVPTADGGPGGFGSDDPRLPLEVAGIARDLLDPALRIDELVTAVRTRRSAVKRALLDQSLVSGVGNIYADEALWRARVHPERATRGLPRLAVRSVLESAAGVMQDALAQGGTSFDALYVDVNGASGYFDRSLSVYGQTGRPCPRCGTAIVRSEFMNRSSHWCPTCQPAPRGAARPVDRGAAARR